MAISKIDLKITISGEASMSDGLWFFCKGSHSPFLFWQSLSLLGFDREKKVKYHSLFSEKKANKGIFNSIMLTYAILSKDTFLNAF